MGYAPIESYGIIGDMRTAALVGSDGSLDWLCFPFFDSPSVFAAILDDAKGGQFVITPTVDDFRSKQLYWPDSNVLVTRFLSPSGVAEITDYMPVGAQADAYGRRCVVRRVASVRGATSFRMCCAPAFDYARATHSVEPTEGGVWFRSPSLTLALGSDVPLTVERGTARAEFRLTQGQEATFVLGDGDPNEVDLRCPERLQSDLLVSTVDYWHRWLSKCTYRGRWREMVYRSALVLKLLTFVPTGAIVAAPTCSLPEAIGGTRNWDYRYTWIRDAAFTLYALLRIGFTDEATSFMKFLAANCHETSADGSLPIMFRIDGQLPVSETQLDHLEGYRASAPVRVGNDAVGQLQLDIYGELLDAVYLYNKYGEPISYDLWAAVRNIVDWVCDNWRQADEGIWESRGGRRHWVYSKLMCWVALDRALRLADKRSLPCDRERWIRARDEVYGEINSRGWNAELRVFVQSYDGESLDASALMMPLVFFVSPSDPRLLQTIDAINRPPEEGGLVADNLVYRYNSVVSPDGLPGEEGTFNICTFWLVEALTRAGSADPSRLDAARVMFDRMLGYANHLGLFAEQTSRSGEALGNFPQAFTHLALISAAFNLDRALDEGS